MPRLILKQFSRPDGGIDWLNLQSRITGVGRSPAAVGYGLGFFDIPTSVGIPASTESWLGDCETAAAVILERLIANPESVGALSDGDEQDFARFCAGLRFRSPTFRDEIARVRSHFGSWARDMFEAWIAHHPEYAADDVERWRSAPLEYFVPGELARPAEEIVAIHFAEIDDYARILRGMDWTIGPTFELFTSDNPMSAAPLNRAPGPGGFGDVTYFYALSTNVLMRFTPAPEAPGPPRGRRTIRAWTDYDRSIAQTVQIADTFEYLYGTNSLHARVQSEARNEAYRLVVARGNEGLARGGDPYSKIGFPAVVKFVTPDDPWWHYKAGS